MGDGDGGGGLPAERAAPGADPTWQRLEDQLTWYERKSIRAQRAYRSVKLVELLIASAVPVVALVQDRRGVTAALAAIVVVLEGWQQVYQWQTNWVLFRTTAEALKRERNLYLAEAGPYRGDDRRRLLAERVESLVSEEQRRWAETREWARVKHPGYGGGGIDRGMGTRRARLTANRAVC